MKNLILFITIALVCLVSCRTESSKQHTINSYELTATRCPYDTINMTIDGLKQGVWLMITSRDTVVYRNDTAYSVIPPSTSGEMAQFLKSGFYGTFKTYDSLAVKSH